MEILPVAERTMYYDKLLDHINDVVISYYQRFILQEPFLKSIEEERDKIRNCHSRQSLIGNIISSLR
eukprot:scaffold248800_cov23-Prasinocladus_malaysianus.AAC.1